MGQACEGMCQDENPDIKPKNQVAIPACLQARVTPPKPDGPPKQDVHSDLAHEEPMSGLNGTGEQQHGLSPLQEHTIQIFFFPTIVWRHGHPAVDTKVLNGQLQHLQIEPFTENIQLTTRLFPGTTSATSVLFSKILERVDLAEKIEVFLNQRRDPDTLRQLPAQVGDPPKTMGKDGEKLSTAEFMELGARNGWQWLSEWQPDCSWLWQPGNANLDPDGWRFAASWQGEWDAHDAGARTALKRKRLFRVQIHTISTQQQSPAAADLSTSVHTPTIGEQQADVSHLFVDTPSTQEADTPIAGSVPLLQGGTPFDEAEAEAESQRRQEAAAEKKAEEERMIAEEQAAAARAEARQHKREAEMERVAASLKEVRRASAGGADAPPATELLADEPTEAQAEAPTEAQAEASVLSEPEEIAAAAEGARLEDLLEQMTGPETIVAAEGNRSLEQMLEEVIEGAGPIMLEEKVVGAPATPIKSSPTEPIAASEEVALVEEEQVAVADTHAAAKPKKKKGSKKKKR